MKRSLKQLCIMVLAVALLAPATSLLAAKGPTRGKNAIILASFGTTVPSAVGSISNIVTQVKKAYPNTEVRLTFTSNIIRSIWKERRADSKKWLDMGIPPEVLNVENIITTVGQLVEEGCTNIVVQPTHMFFMEESTDLSQYVKALGSIHTIKQRWQPLDRIIMGRPALGQPGDLHSYHDDVKAAAKTLAGDVAMAKKAGAALVYMGHGNEHWSTGIYATMQREMRTMYPQVKTIIGVVEGAPDVEDVTRQLKHAGTKKVVLKPFMIVAGDHATNDMAGDEPDSWLSVLKKDGYTVTPVLKGLGRNDAFVQLFINHISDAAKEGGIDLK